MNQTTIWLLGSIILIAGPIVSDEVTITRDGCELKLEGRILDEAQNDNGILFQTRDGKLWPLDPDQIKSKSKNDIGLEPFGKLDLGRSLLDELGADFKVHDAGNFVFLYNTETAYARWVAGLYRRLDKGFGNFWKRKRFKLATKPDFPLAVIIFKSRDEYERFMQQDIGGVNAGMLAYYNLETNRVAMFDLTADEVQPGAELSDRQITQVLNNPRAIPMVATVIHEGTHQLMFNYGMQTRFSDTPLWVNEGLAMYFETPDLNATRGWRKIGQINFSRLRQFLQFMQTRPADSLAKMIQSDEGFRNETALENYAQAWAFNYFLLNKHQEPYVDYLKHMSKKPRLIFDTPEQRLEEFEKFFDISIEELDRQLIQYIRKLNR